MATKTTAVVTWLEEGKPDTEVRLSMADRVAAADKFGGDIGSSPRTEAYATYLALKRTGYEATFQQFLEESDALIASGGDGLGN